MSAIYHGNVKYTGISSGSVKQIQTESGDNDYPILFSGSTADETIQTVVGKSTKLYYNPSTQKLNLEYNGLTYVIPDDLSHKLSVGKVTKSAGEKVRIPASGTNSFITTNSIIEPYGEEYSDGTPMKWSKIDVYNGYVEITLSKAISNQEVSILIHM